MLAGKLPATGGVEEPPHAGLLESDLLLEEGDLRVMRGRVLKLGKARLGQGVNVIARDGCEAALPILGGGNLAGLAGHGAYPWALAVSAFRSTALRISTFPRPQAAASCMRSMSGI